MTEQTPECAVDGCTEPAVITKPLPLCAADASLVAAATEQALEADDATMSRVQALATIKANPAVTDDDLAARTGWPEEWVARHRAG